MERMSLKHQNSGKWAKSKAIMAKYDLEVRHRQSERRYGIKGKKGKAVHFVEIDGPALSLLLCHIKGFVGQHASLIFLTVFALKIRSFQNSFVQQNEPSGLLITKK